MIRHSKPSISNQEIKKIAGVLASQCIAEGREVEHFEHSVARYLHMSYACAVSSGTAALYMALKALNIQEGDEIILPSYTCASVYQAVTMAFAQPVLCDISRDDYNISVESAQKKMSKKTKAIIIPHMFGCPADTRSFKKLSVPIIEDCAQSCGAHIGSAAAGSCGSICVLSFYATKLMTTGEGGMVVTDRREVIERINDMHACDKKSDLTQRFNFKMTDFQAAMGTVQLKRLPEFIRKRKKIALAYSDAFKAIEELDVPRAGTKSEHIYFRYIVRFSKTAKEIVRQYQTAGIEAQRPVDIPLHRMAGLNPREFPNTEYACVYAVSIPLYPALTDKEVQHIIRVTKTIGN